MKRICFLFAALAISIVPVWPEDDELPVDEFVIAFTRSSIDFNPIYSYTITEAQIYTGLHEGLVAYHPETMEPVPAVAERWEISNDGRIYTFHLREDARFSNGDPLLAEHFRDTWLTLLSPDNKAAYSFLFDLIRGVREYRSGEASGRQGVGIRAVGPRILEVELRQRTTHFLQMLSHHSFVAVHPSLLPHRSWRNLTDIPVNGPFRLLRWSDDEIVLTRNEEYWDVANVALPRIRMLFMDNPSRVTERFNNNEIDWVVGGMSLSDVLVPQAIVINPLFATNYYFLQARQEPFSDPRVRRALALLLPWEQIRDPEMHFMPSPVLVPPIPFYPEVSGIVETDVEQALGLLEEAGFPEGRQLPSLIIHIHEGPEAMRVAELARDAWEAALNQVPEIRVTPFSRYHDALREGTFTMGTMGWIGDYADPLTFLQMWIGDSNANDAGFSDPRYDGLIDQAMGQSGVSRYETLAEAEEILLQTGVILPVSHSPAVNLIDLRAVAGWFPNPLDIHPLKHLRFSTGAPVPGVIRFDQPTRNRLYSHQP
jgi:peptide/nickel transport system substrate-binding protein/oligopeptide transport system substrate-binding protein